MWFEVYKDNVKKLVIQTLREEGFTEEFDFVDIASYGSRITGKALEESDFLRSITSTNLYY